MATVPLSWLDEAFKSAKEDFKRSLKNPALYDFSKISSIDDVLEEARKIERQQEKTKMLRGLKRVQPLINGLKEYSGVIEVFAQAKPDVMSLVWGPLKFILQASSSIISTFEKVVKVIGDLGMTLPSFKVYTQLFQSNHDVRRALCLFYADILDFYAILLNFLTKPTLNNILESLWPNIRSSIAKVQENMENHKAMMMTNVTMEDILRAHQARKRMLEEHERAQAFRDSQTFSAIRNELEPHNHDASLADILRRSSVNSGRWLENEADFMKWLDTTDRTMRCMWLHGIPGSGKTFLVGNLIKRMQVSGQRVIFALLSHDNQGAGDTVKVFHSFLFQLLEGDPTFRPILHDSSQSNYRRLKNDSDFVFDFLCRILNSLGPSFIILDGLDELDESSCKDLLSNILKINEKCVETKLLISSREDRDISLRLSGKAVPLRVDYKNFEDIDKLVQLECEDLLLEMRGYGADERTCLKVKEKLATIAENAQGGFASNDKHRMFIYARLVLLMVKDQGTLHDIEEQMEDLPDGLDEVYGRLLVRIKTKLTRTLRTVARCILQWVACAQRPLREEEMLQILAVQPGQQDFTKGRKEFRDICKVCGPIVEVNEGNIRFVHFSAKEYLLHEQSDNFLNLSEAHLDATLVCTTYLSFSSLNPLFLSSSDGMLDMQQRILGGDYVMFEYASMGFLEHLKAFLEAHNGELDTHLIATLTLFQEIRSNTSIDTSFVPQRFVHMFKSFADMPIIQNCLSIAAYSQTKAQLGLFEQDEVVNSAIHDPLKIFSARRKLRKHLEDMMCHDSNHTISCRCDELTRLYGAKLYHCDQRFCYAYRNGFDSKSVRDQHLGIHQRTHKCSIASCLFGEIGFRDATELQRHMCQAHPPRISGEDSSHSSISPIPLHDKFDIIRDAVKLDQTELVKELVSDFEEFRRILEMRYLEPVDILGLACYHASQDTVSFLFDGLSSESSELTYPSTNDLLAVALDAENLPIVKFLLSRGADMSKETTSSSELPSQIPVRLKMRERYSGYIRALRLWSPSLMAYLVDECRVEFPTEIENPGVIFRSPAIQGATEEEARRRFNGIKKYIIWPEAYDRGVTEALRSRCVTSARICLENGGDPNGVSRKSYTSGQSRESRPAIYEAVKLGSRKGAEMVKLLLQCGADPEHRFTKGITKLRGMKAIERYFGFTWEEIVRRIQAGEDLPITTNRRRK
ncbi:hypothetical protein F5Y06DRAFT_293941 [Hypoxylon sp. FL0890]|nr:hypothetical protein F5Y06DRAFT_293941 [Hypoxylon sp. FL0890]